jgi:hypothetical protein
VNQRRYLSIRIDSEVFRLEVILPWNTEIVALIAQAFSFNVKRTLTDAWVSPGVIQNEHLFLLS